MSWCPNEAENRDESVMLLQSSSSQSPPPGGGLLSGIGSETRPRAGRDAAARLKPERNPADERQAADPPSGALFPLWPSWRTFMRRIFINRKLAALTIIVVMAIVGLVYA